MIFPDLLPQLLECTGPGDDDIRVSAGKNVARSFYLEALGNKRFAYLQGLSKLAGFAQGL